MDMEQSYLFLMTNTKALLDKYSYEELVNKGRFLPYRKRVTFDYKLICKMYNQKFYEVVSILKNEERFLELLMERNELDYILNSIKEIVRPNNLNPNVLLYLKKNMELIPEDKLEEIKEHIVFCISEFQSIKRDNNLYVLKDLLEDTASKEGLSILDIRKITYGGYSKIYRLGDKIIKIGVDRICNSIPDNKRLLIPDFKGYVGSDFVEITDYLDCEDKPSYDEIYEIYKELREQGIRWLDPTEFNLAHVNGKVLENIKAKRNIHNLQEVGIIENDSTNIEELNVGDYVIIDLDHMFWDYEDSKIFLARRELNEMLNTKEGLYDLRYKKEKNGEFELTKKM